MWSFRIVKWCGARAPIVVDDVALDPAGGDIADHFGSGTNPRTIVSMCVGRR